MDNNKQIDRALLMLDSSPVAVSFFNSDMDCVDCNRSAVKMFNFKNKEEYINGFYRSMPPFQSHKKSSIRIFGDLLNKAFARGRAKSEFLCQRADGTLIPVEMTLVRVAHEGSDVVIIYFHDLTEIKAVMKEAADSAQTAQMYLAASPLAVELFDDQLRIRECNQKAVELLGFPNPEEYLKRLTYMAPDYLYNETYTREKDREYARQAMRNRYVRYEWVFFRENGEQIPCEITRVRIAGSGRMYVISYIHDLSTIAAMAEELKKAEAAEKENRAKSQFLAQMSHVLLTPMNSISGIAEIQLQKDKGLTREESKELFMQIQRSSGMLLGIINDILELSKAESGAMDIAKKRIDIPSLIIEIVQLSVLDTQNDNIHFTINVDKNLPCILIGDHIRIKQIANYILSNAFKYTERGEVNLRLSVEPNPDADGLIFIMRISDTGCGMTQEQADNLFGGRYNEQASILGTGLGLTITHRLIQLMKGTIKVTSQVGEGSVFTVRLPLEADTDLVLGEEEAERLENVEAVRNTLGQRETIEYEPMPYGKVLVVDDVESNLYVAWGLMKPYGIDIDTANSGFEAIEKIKHGAEYDIIFMDHMMPDLDGIQTARAIMNLGYEKPIVALTANTIFGQDSLFRENGFEGFISKPIDIKMLNACLLRLIRDQYPEDVREQARASMAKAALSGNAEEAAVSNELIKHFIRDAKNSVAILESLAAQPTMSPENLKTFTITTHGMKSALANVNILYLSKVAGTLEDAGRDNNLTLIAAETPPFIANLRETIAAFEEKLPKEAEDVADDPAILKPQLAAIIQACETYSKATAKRAINTLNENPHSKKTADFIDEISSLLLHGEFEMAAELAQGYLDGL